ncbi:hypothetical protein ZWY2020_000512 [Hordeum vulgare]|nr:hypothetical protein ZWY2020_000512 [Hordeum vulgare]
MSGRGKGGKGLGKGDAKIHRKTYPNPLQDNTAYCIVKQYFVNPDDTVCQKGGYRGFYARNTIDLTPKSVNDIHKRGGTILGSSRGGHDTMKIVDSIQYRRINQCYPSKFTGLDKASVVFESAVRTILTVLKSSAFSRDCLVASGVSLCAAIQLKTSILADFTDFFGGYKPFSRDVVNRVLKIIWSNLEDPLSQTVKQVHLIFDLLLDIESSLPSGDQSVKLVLCDIEMIYFA